MLGKTSSGQWSELLLITLVLWLYGNSLTAHTHRTESKLLLSYLATIQVASKKTASLRAEKDSSSLSPSETPFPLILRSDDLFCNLAARPLGSLS